MASKLLLDTSPLKESKHFARLWLGLAVANFGAQMTAIAVALEVYQLTNSSLHVGYVGLAGLVPLIVLGLYGGALVDLFDRRKIALIASTVLWLVTWGFAAQAYFEVNKTWLLYLLIAIQSAAFAINNPARQAIIPRLLPAKSLPAANALTTMTWNIALMGGPLLAALLVSQFGFFTTYLVDALLYTSVIYAVIKLPKLEPLSQQSGAEGAVVKKEFGFRAVLVGLKYLSTQPNVRMTFLLDLAAMILAMPRVLFPAVAVMIIGGGETTVGYLTAAFAVGAVIASVFSGLYSSVVRQGRTIVLAIVVWALSITSFGLLLLAAGDLASNDVKWRLLLIVSLVLAIAGGADAVSAVFRQTMLQSATPDHLRGRLQGVFIVVVAGGPRLGELFLGWQAHLFGEAIAAVVGGLLCLIVVILLAISQRGFWQYDARNPQP